MLKSVYSDRGGGGLKKTYNIHQKGSLDFKALTIKY